MNEMKGSFEVPKFENELDKFRQILDPDFFMKIPTDEREGFMKKIKEFLDDPSIVKIIDIEDFRTYYIRTDGTIIKDIPISDGTWSGERGNSIWYPDKDYHPKKDNPENMSWREILEKYGIDGIEFKDGHPDFSEVSKADVEIKMTSSRAINFGLARKALASEGKYTEDEIKAWMEENNYTWHDHQDGKTMQKVPKVIHNNVQHAGGISEIKRQEAEK